MWIRRIRISLLVLTGIAAGLTQGMPRLVLLIPFLVLLTWSSMETNSLRGKGIEVSMGQHGPVETRWFRLLEMIAWMMLLGLAMILLLGGLVRFGYIPTNLRYGLQVLVTPSALGLMLLLELIVGVRTQYGAATRFATPSAKGIMGLAIVPAFIGIVVSLLLVAGQELSIGGEPLQERDASYLVILTIVGFAISNMIRGHVPTPYQIIVRPDIDEEVKERHDTPPFLYAGLAALSVALLAGFILYKVDLLTYLSPIVGTVESAYLLAVLPLAVATFFLVGRIRIMAEGRRGLYTKKTPVRLQQAIAVFSFGIISGGTFAALAYMVLTGRLAYIGPFEAGYDLAIDLLTLSVTFSLGPVGWFLVRESRRMDGIEARLPDFLEDLAEGRLAGLTLPNALEAVSQNDYGPLSKEVTRMKNQLAWGLPFTEVFTGLSERVKSSLVQRSVRLIIEASNSGGSIAQILKAAAKDARELKALDHERRVSLSTYLIVIYVTYFVFLFVLGVLDAQFVPQVVEAQTKLAESRLGENSGGLGSISTEVLDAPRLHFTYFTACFVQAIGNGIVGGILVERRVSAGLRHVAIMAAMAWITFRFILPLLF